MKYRMSAIKYTEEMKEVMNQDIKFDFNMITGRHESQDHEQTMSYKSESQSLSLAKSPLK